jgi:hypothetical protein
MCSHGECVGRKSGSPWECENVFSTPPLTNVFSWRVCRQKERESSSVAKFLNVLYIMTSIAPHMTHVSSSSYDTCILLLIWHMYPHVSNVLYIMTSIGQSLLRMCSLRLLLLMCSHGECAGSLNVLYIMTSIGQWLLIHVRPVPIHVRPVPIHNDFYRAMTFDTCETCPNTCETCPNT